jgi:hypothetical protein
MQRFSALLNGNSEYGSHGLLQVVQARVLPSFSSFGFATTFAP